MDRYETNYIQSDAALRRGLRDHCRLPQHF